MRARVSCVEGKRAAFLLGVLSALLAAACVLALFAGLPFASTGPSAEALELSDPAFPESGFAERGFPTPEETIAFFFERVAAEDYDGALSVCAIRTLAENFDFNTMTDRIRSLHPGAMLPSEYALFRRYDEARQKADILRQIAWLSLSVTLPEEYTDYVKAFPITGERADASKFIKGADPAPLKGMVIVDTGESYLKDREENQKTLQRQVDVYGAKAGTARDVLYQIDGNYYAGGVTLLEYDSGWLIQSLSDPLIGQSAFGSLIPLESEADFADLLAGTSP